MAVGSRVGGGDGWGEMETTVCEQQYKMIRKEKKTVIHTHIKYITFPQIWKLGSWKLLRLSYMCVCNVCVCTHTHIYT